MTIWPSNPTPGHIPGENSTPKDTCTPIFTAALFTTARTWKQPKCPSVAKWIEHVVHICSGVLLNHKKERNWAISRHMDEPRECHREWISQTEKQMSYSTSHMCNLENGTGDLFAKQKKSHRCREQMYGHQGGKGKVGWIERLGLTYTLPCLK